MERNLPISTDPTYKEWKPITDFLIPTSSAFSTDPTYKEWKLEHPKQKLGLCLRHGSYLQGMETRLA